MLHHYHSLNGIEPRVAQVEPRQEADGVAYATGAHAQAIASGTMNLHYGMVGSA